ncbi:serine proteinase stubble [Anopheles darlingi]|uniref:serine proteinase stubble n=1 Tax=Anopheles darlingi TaxID=43151 RepID=UPI002100546C|nr:serine proteinase stubble [Anopheles darlingi]
MFAIDCFKANGTHLGVCIDKIFFGSCCQVNDDRLLFDPDITDNSIDHNSVGSFGQQHFPQSSVMNTHRKPPLTETRLPTTNGNGTKYELISSSSTTTRRTTPKTPPPGRRTTATAHVRTTTKAPLKLQQKDDIQTTTEYQEFTTFQYVQSSKNPAVSPGASTSTNKRPTVRPTGASARPTVLDTRKPTTKVQQATTTTTTTTTTTKPYKTRRPTPNKTTIRTVPPRRPVPPQTTPSSTTNAAPTTTSTSTTKRVASPVTRLPNNTSTTSRKPPSTISSSTTFASRRPTTTQSPLKTDSTTPQRRPTTGPTLVPLTRPTVNRKRPSIPTTTSESPETTRAPRPRPKPTAQIATVPATSLDHLIESQVVTKVPPPSSTVTRVTYPITTDKVTVATTPTPTPTPSTTGRTTAELPILSSTIKAPAGASAIGLGGTEDLATLSRPGLVTWTSILDDTPTERPSSSQVIKLTSMNHQPTSSTTTVTTTTTTKRTSTTTIVEDVVTKGVTTPTSTKRTTTTPTTTTIPTTTSTISTRLPPSQLGSIGSTAPIETTLAATTPSSTSTVATSTGHITSSAAPTPTTRAGTSTTPSTVKPVPLAASSSTTESQLLRETTTVEATSVSSIVNGTGSASSSSSSTSLPVTATDAAKIPSTVNATSTTATATTATMTTGMPVKFPDQMANQTATIPTTTTLAMLANITTDGVTLAPDFLTTSTVPSLEGIDYRSVCGKRMFPEPRIVGGTKAAFGRWPWQISLRQWRTSTYLHKCGAALLNENWAITAAHCVDNVPPSDLLLRLGEYDLALEEEPYGYQERRVQIVASHPQFDPRTFEYDLALLRFYEPVSFQPNIIPVCVPENDENFIGRTAFVTGWGRLYEDGPLPSVLQEVTVPVIENKICETMYRSAGYIEHIPHIFICAGWKKGGYDSCEGDSGGPMVIQRPDKRFLLAGVISWGIGCAEPNQPGVYTRISEFRDWINQILQF